MKGALALAILVHAFAASAGGPGIDTGKVAMVSSVNLDTAAAWKKFLAIDGAIGKEKSLARLDALAGKAEANEAGLMKLFPEGRLAQDLNRYQRDRIRSRKHAVRPQPGRRPKPDLWKEAAGAFEGLQLRFNIVEGFRKRGISTTFAEEMEAGLPDALARLAESLGKAEADSPEPAGFPGLVAKDAKSQGGPKKSDAIRAFMSMAKDSLAAWSGKP